MEGRLAVKESRKASNKPVRAVSWEQRRRRGHGQEGTGAGPPAQSNRMKSSTPMSVCRRMARKVPRSSSRYAPKLESLWLAVIVRATLQLTPPFTKRYLSESAPRGREEQFVIYGLR
jgi:hypothetical protein